MGFLSGAQGKWGSRDDVTWFHTYRGPPLNTRYDSGLRLEPLDSVEPLQPQLQRGYPATLPGRHRAPSCLWGGSVPGPRHGG